MLQQVGEPTHVLLGPALQHTIFTDQPPLTMPSTSAIRLHLPGPTALNLLLLIVAANLNGTYYASIGASRLFCLLEVLCPRNIEGHIRTGIELCDSAHRVV